MRKVLESDTGFYYAIGLFMIAVFLVGIAAVAVFSPAGVGSRGLVGLTGGFLLFVLVYVISISVQRLEERDG